MEWRVFLMFIAYTLYLFIQIYNFNLYNYFTNLIIIQKKKKKLYNFYNIQPQYIIERFATNFTPSRQHNNQPNSK